MTLAVFLADRLTNCSILLLSGVALHEILSTMTTNFQLHVLYCSVWSFRKCRPMKLCFV